MHLIMNGLAQDATRGRKWHSSVLTHMHLIMNGLAEPCTRCSARPFIIRCCTKCNKRKKVAQLQQ